MVEDRTKDCLALLPQRPRQDERRTGALLKFRPQFFSLVSWLRFIDLAVLHERWQSAKLREETLIPLDQLLHREAEP
jgi:hypothetical protein